MLMILVGSGMAIIVPQYSQEMWTLFYTVTMLPLTWLPGMKEIGFISTIGLVKYNPCYEILFSVHPLVH